MTRETTKEIISSCVPLIAAGHHPQGASNLLPTFGLLIALAAFPVPAIAGMTADMDSTSVEGASLPAIIIVEARKTSESEADIPESVSVVGPERLAEAPLDMMEAIARNSPNVRLVNFAGNSSFFSIRGVSSLGVPVNNSDGTISFNLDGVPASNIALAGNFVDIDQVEVLRGPQGTLWGTNALAGAINLRSNPINGTEEIGFSGEAGSNGYLLGQMVAAGAIVPGSLDGRFAAKFTLYDGDIRSVLTPKLGSSDLLSFRGGLRATTGGGTVVTLDGRYYRNKTAPPFFLHRDAAAFPISGTLSLPEQTTELISGSLSIVHKFDAFVLTSISGGQANANSGSRDATDILMNEAQGLPEEANDSQAGYTSDKEIVLSQELRLNSLDNSPVRWVVGASLLYNNTRRTFLHPALPIVSRARLRSYDVALFGDVSIPLAERLEIGGGVRLSAGHIAVRYTNEDFPSLEGQGSTDDRYLTGKMTVSYRLTGNLLTYASVARGHSTELYELYAWGDDGTVLDPYPASKGWTYETGAKWSFIEDRVHLSGSGFYNRIRDGVLTYIDPDDPSTFSTTLQDYDTKGFEVQLRAQLTRNLFASGGVGYVHAAIKGDNQDDRFVGHSVPNIPPWTFNAALGYTHPVTIFGTQGEISFTSDYQFVTRRPADIDRSFDLDKYHLVNTRLGWSTATGRVSIYAFARNLFDKRYEVYGANQGLGAQSVMVARGRIAGVGVSRQF